MELRGKSFCCRRGRWPVRHRLATPLAPDAAQLLFPQSRPSFSGKCRHIRTYVSLLISASKWDGRCSVQQMHGVNLQDMQAKSVPELKEAPCSRICVEELLFLLGRRDRAVDDRTRGQAADVGKPLLLDCRPADELVFLREPPFYTLSMARLSFEVQQGIVRQQSQFATIAFGTKCGTTGR